MNNQQTSEKLTLKDLQKELLDVSVISEFPLENGKVIKYHKLFDGVDIKELLKEIVLDMKYADSKNYDFFNNDGEFLNYILLLIIKRFSHLGDEIGESFEEKIEALDVMTRLSYFNLFFEEIFLKDEVAKVIEEVNKVIDFSLQVVQEENRIIEFQKKQNK